MIPPRPSPPSRAEPEAGSATARSPRHLVVAVVDRFNAVLFTALALALGAMAAMAIGQVAARYLVGQPLVWSEEFMRFALIWVTFLGAGVAVRKGMLIAVEIVVHFVPAPVGRLARWLTLIATAAFWMVLIVFGIRILGMVQGMKSGAMELPMPFVYLAIPVGAAIAFVNTLVVALDPPLPFAEGSPS
ncbi:TRAP transporter small permease [Salinarimonas rosea]|uniref:TRAP transporter small permease n=1 Tax=Salinarimonas rosea TaxID=552063 RepID=UPI000A01886F|nr:TRAP transporter small permease [Salinarimonas rosea]